MAVPGELYGVREWSEIRDGPLVAVGTASADESHNRCRLKLMKTRSAVSPGCEGERRL